MKQSELNMYLQHFQFATPPFRQVTTPAGEFTVARHQDVFGLLAEKTRQPGIVGLFSADEALLKQFSHRLSTQVANTHIVNAFPKLSAETLLYKLNPDGQASKNWIQTIDAIFRRWQSQCGKQTVLVISAAQAISDNAWSLLGMLLSRAEEQGFTLSILLTGTAEAETKLMSMPGLSALMHTCHTLRPLSGRECEAYFAARMKEQGVETSPFPRDRIRKIHALTQGNITQINRLAHLALLAAWTERAPRVCSRHLRLACDEIIPARRSAKKWATIALVTVFACLAGGWYAPPSLTAKLPFSIPTPASWQQMARTEAPPPPPSINDEVISEADSMHQLYKIWGYDATADDALCYNAKRAMLQCREGRATLAEREKEGYPWIAELKTGDRLNYAVVAHIENNTVDLLLNGRTWQVSRNWFVHNATGNYTLLRRLTPAGQNSVNANSPVGDIIWLDNALSQALNVEPTHTTGWSAELVKRVREFQSTRGLRVDGVPGDETLLRLMHSINMTPTVISPVHLSRVEKTQQGSES
ncbi:ExeA family protein [Scandinavium hiltneri]|uniref:ExeA family protein n=1 Tax=Scandinavium hiltneri TaxID=2926519 RepID=UPI002869D983|nr:peptidoglycan-binding protein [Scandinavium hiltneri]